MKNDVDFSKMNVGLYERIQKLRSEIHFAENEILMLTLDYGESEVLKEYEQKIGEMSVELKSFEIE